MLSFLSWFSLTTSIVLVLRVFVLRRYVSGLTVAYSWTWAIAALPALMMATLATGNIVSLPIGWKMAAQYFAVIMLLTPAVSTLGARKPGVGTWQCFVVAPLILVLQWPGTSQLISSRGREALDLGAPATTGVLLVILMSAGTGLGTSMSASATIYIAAVICCLLPSSGWIEPASSLPLFAAPLLLLAEVQASRVVYARYKALRAAETGSAVIDETWMLFQDLYGLVWARRVLDRVNQFAQREQWAVLLTMDGFRRCDNGQLASDAELQKPLEAFSWVLSRFADHSWIDDRFVFWFGDREKQNSSTGTDQFRRIYPVVD